jgi:3-(3-hydroxy-phenyl)propionate hydroxylase
LVGTRIPQPQVVDHTGRRTLLDDVTYGGWSVLLRPLGHEKTAEAVRAWEDLGARTFVLVDHAAGEPGELRDHDGLLREALKAADVDALVLRPDAFVYTAARAGEPLCGPPVSLARPATTRETSVSSPSTGEQVLAALAGKLDDRALERVLGHRLALTAIFRELAAAFVPRVANGFVGEIQYDLQDERGTARSFTVQVTRSAARARAGAAQAPALTIRVRTADFLRLAAGELSELDLMRARRIDLQGDGLLGARMGAMFGRPAPVDQYVRPTTVDPPARPATVRNLQEA